MCFCCCVCTALFICLLSVSHRLRGCSEVTLVVSQMTVERLMSIAREILLTTASETRKSMTVLLWWCRKAFNYHMSGPESWSICSINERDSKNIACQIKLLKIMLCSFNVMISGFLKLAHTHIPFTEYTVFYPTSSENKFDFSWSPYITVTINMHEPQSAK